MNIETISYKYRWILFQPGVIPKWLLHCRVVLSERFFASAKNQSPVISFKRSTRAWMNFTAFGRARKLSKSRWLLGRKKSDKPRNRTSISSRLPWRGRRLQGVGPYYAPKGGREYQHRWNPTAKIFRETRAPMWVRPASSTTRLVTTTTRWLTNFRELSRTPS